LRVPPARVRRRAGRRAGDERIRADPRRRAGLAARAHAARDRQPSRGRALRAIRPPGMKPAILATPLLVLALLPVRTPAPRPTPEDDDERAADAVRFEEPAPEMRKLGVLSGAWALEERWAQPGRWKRGHYEGVPGPGGSGILTFRPGPGGFSLVGDYDARNPMGHVTGLGVLAWDPRGRRYELDEIHSALPGVLHLTGRFENGDLVFRGTDAREGAPRPVVVTWRGLGQDSWSA